MPRYELQKLLKQKRSKTLAVLGSARSINAITHEEWARLSKIDTLAINNWVYHPFFVPNFYAIEVKHYDYDIVRRRLAEKWEAYRECAFMFLKGKRVRFPDGRTAPLTALVPKDAATYDVVTRPRNPKRVGKIDANYKPAKGWVLTKTGDASVTMLLELAWRMNYKNVVLYGMDFYHSYYFWSSGDPKYGEVHHLTNKAHENKDPHEPYATVVMRDFITDFSKQWMWKQGRRMYVGSNDTTLFPEIPLADWNEIGIT